MVQLISAEFTGPLHFVQFWLDVIGEWEKETGKKATVALSATKDVQDAILNDTQRAKLVDIIDIRYWHYKVDGLYAPEGGKNLAPRQHARKMKVGKVTFDEAYRAVSEYRKKFPEKRLLTMRRIIRIWLGLSSWQVALARLFRLPMKAF